MISSPLSFSIVPASVLTGLQRHGISRLCHDAFDEDPWSQYAFMQDAVHVIGQVKGAKESDIITHALWIDRQCCINRQQVINTAYVEYVATRDAYQKQGLASALLAYLIIQVKKQGYQLAGLSPANSDFYQRLGWQLWPGQLSILQGNDYIATPDECVMLYPLSPSMQVLLESITVNDELSAEWREGELW